MSSLVSMPQQPNAVVVSREWENQLELISRTVAPGLNREEFELFLHVCRVRHLDPLQRQVHAVKRRTKEGDQWVDKMTIQTGIDGYRAIANRTGVYMPSEKEARVEAQKQDNSDLRVTMWVKKYHTLSATWHEFSATAYYREFVQTYKDQSGKFLPNSMWTKMPINQLTKCAEALALRKGWPEELGNIYTDEEMQHADSSSFVPPDPAPNKQDKTKRDLGTLKPSTEPNRGHGNEGTERTQVAAQQTQQKAETAAKKEPVMCGECRLIDGHADDCKGNPKNQTAAAGTTAATGAKLSKREQWAQSPGHDPKIHIGFSDAVQLFNIQSDLKVKDADMKAFLDREFEIQHRYLIRQDMFQNILDAIAKEFGGSGSAQPPAE